MSFTYLIGMGSNIGNRLSYISKAVNHIQKIATVSNSSFLYESAPMFFLEQQSFLNCAIQVKCNLEKQQLSKQLKNIEHLLGRKRDKSNVNAPRTIDLDVISPSEDTDISKCNFVASPIRDIDPDLMIAVHNDKWMSANDIAEKLSQNNDSSQNITQLLALVPNILDCDIAYDCNQDFDSKFLYQVSNSNKTIKKRSLRMARLDLKNNYKTADQVINQVEKIVNNNKVDVITVGYGSFYENLNNNIDSGICQDCILNIVSEIRKQFGDDIIICVETNHVNIAKESILSGKVNIISHNCSTPMLNTMSQLKVANIFNTNNVNNNNNNNIENVINTAILDYSMLRWNIIVNDDIQTSIQRYPTICTQQFNSLTA